MSGVSMADYAQEFIRLTRYTLYIVPTKVVRVERFRARLIMPLYNALVATEFSTLIKVINKAKQLEARYKEERAEREEKEER